MPQPGSAALSSHEAPLRLTASDGTGLRLTALDAAVAIRGPLAFTELTLDFENPLDRVLEGRFEVVLPTGAAVSRFAMQLPTGWQEAEVLEKQAARRAYEDFLHRRQDPALLEKAAGNQFSARVFPIPAWGVKRIKIAWSQELPSEDEPYRLPLAGLPLLPALRIVVNAELELVRVVRERFRPDGDFVLERPGIARGLRSGKLAVGQLRAPLPPAPATMEAVTILFDSSASRAIGFRRQVDALGALVDELARVHGGGLPVVVAAFDQEVAPIYDGAASGFDRRAREQLIERGALGATDVAGALAWAAADANRRGDGRRRLVLVTDGVATASPTPTAADGEAARMKSALASLRARFDRLDVVLVGGIRDEPPMRALTTGGLARDGAVLDGDDDARRIVRRLDEATRADVRVAVAGAAWSSPERLDGIQAGDDLLVYAEYPEGREPRTMEVRLSGPVEQRAEVPLVEERAEMRPLVERAWVRARIASLAAEESRAAATSADRAAALHRQMVELSTRHRVLCDATALLVLETEADYARFGIDRHALADILTVDEHGLRLEHRTGAVLATAPTWLAAEPRRFSFSRFATEGEGRDIPRSPAPATDRDSTRRSDHAGPGGALGLFRAAPAPPAAAALDELASDGVGAAGAADEPRTMMPPEAGRMMDPDGAGGGSGSGYGRGARGRDPPRADMIPDRFARVGHGSAIAPSIASPLAVLGARGSVGSGSAYGGGGVSLGPTPPPETGVPAHSGRMLEVMKLVENRRLDDALAKARAWRAEEPGDVLALVALGDVYRARKRAPEAARAWGSIIDLFPARADLRRFAGDLLESLGSVGGPLAADTFARALADRPDHPNSHRLRAYALLRAGRFAEAFAAIETGAARPYPWGRFARVDRILREDAGLLAAAWLRHDPKQRAAVTERLARLGARLPTGPSLRFVLSWETDANDVDFHIADRDGNRAWFGSRHLASGGDLYDDVTTGYGPECFTIEGRSTAYPYQLKAHYYSRGPMGYGMGKLEIVQHDGAGDLRFDERPFVVMNDYAYVDLGRLEGPLWPHR